MSKSCIIAVGALLMLLLAEAVVPPVFIIDNQGPLSSRYAGHAWPGAGQTSSLNYPQLSIELQVITLLAILVLMMAVWPGCSWSTARRPAHNHFPDELVADNKQTDVRVLHHDGRRI